MFSSLHLLEGLSSRNVLILGILLTVSYLTSQRFHKGLNKFPGPRIASVTNIWRAIDMYRRDTHITYRKLHAKYGDIVRVAPNVLSFSDPAAIRDIYSLNKGYFKVSSWTFHMIRKASLTQERVVTMMSLQQ